MQSTNVSSLAYNDFITFIRNEMPHTLARAFLLMLHERHGEESVKQFIWRNPPGINERFEAAQKESKSTGQTGETASKLDLTPEENTILQSFSLELPRRSMLVGAGAFAMGVLLTTASSYAQCEWMLNPEEKDLAQAGINAGLSTAAVGALIFVASMKKEKAQYKHIKDNPTYVTDYLSELANALGEERNRVCNNSKPAPRYVG